jgi:hypothetical protein
LEQVDQVVLKPLYLPKVQILLLVQLLQLAVVLAVDIESMDFMLVALEAQAAVVAIMR